MYNTQFITAQFLNAQRLHLMLLSLILLCIKCYMTLCMFSWPYLCQHSKESWSSGGPFQNLHWALWRTCWNCLWALLEKQERKTPGLTVCWFLTSAMTFLSLQSNFFGKSFSSPFGTFTYLGSLWGMLLK